MPEADGAPEPGSPRELQTIRIRQALPPEQETLTALQMRAALENENDRDGLLAHPDMVAMPMAQIQAGQVLVAETGRGLCGFASMVFRHDGDIEIDGLFVEPRHWRAGVGRALVEECCTLARRTNARAVHVVGNPAARGFYEACGFEEFGREETELGEGILFRRSL